MKRPLVFAIGAMLAAVAIYLAAYRLPLELYRRQCERLQQIVVLDVAKYRKFVSLREEALRTNSFSAYNDHFISKQVEHDRSFLPFLKYVSVRYKIDGVEAFIYRNVYLDYPSLVPAIGHDPIEYSCSSDRLVERPYF